MATLNHQNDNLRIFNYGSLVKDAIVEKFDNFSKSHLPEKWPMNPMNILSDC
jgi:hypothetical protein